MAFRTSETVTVSEHWLPAPATAPEKVPKLLLNGTKWYHFGKKNQSHESFFRNGNRFGKFITHPHLRKTSETVPFCTY